MKRATPPINNIVNTGRTFDNTESYEPSLSKPSRIEQWPHTQMSTTQKPPVANHK